MRTLTTLLLLSLSLLCARPAAAADSLESILAAARKSGALGRALRHAYFEGGAGSRADLVEYRILKEGEDLEAVFVEHFKDGGFNSMTYRLSASGALLEVVVESGTKESYPKPTSRRRSRVEDGVLVPVAPAPGEPPHAGPKVPLAPDVIPMPILMFLLPALAEDLPPTLSVRPLFEDKVAPRPFNFQRGEAGKEGIPVVIEAESGDALMTILVRPNGPQKGAISRIELGGGEEVILPIAPQEARARIAALRAPAAPR